MNLDFYLFGVLFCLSQSLLCSPGWPETYGDPAASASECRDYRLACVFACKCQGAILLGTLAGREGGVFLSQTSVKTFIFHSATEWTRSMF